MALGNKTLDDLLKPISAQLEHAQVASSVEMPAWEFKAARLTDGLNAEQLVDMFQSEAEKIRVAVHRTKAVDLATCIAGIVGAGHPDDGRAVEVVCADDDRFKSVGVYDAIDASALVSNSTVWGEATADEDVQAALAATYGVTYAAAGIAETGTVAQPTDVRCGRAISLLPLVHVAVVDAAAIKPTMAEVLADYGDDAANLPSQLCFISGPSATADIELVRVEGVHGPMYVHYVVVE